MKLIVLCFLISVFHAAGSVYSQKAMFSMNYEEDNLVAITTTEINEQQNEVTGNVTEAATGESLPGVSIVIRGTSIGTVTDADGNYLLSNVPDDAVLVFSFVGMETHEINVEGRAVINVAMEPMLTVMDEVIVVGYGTMRKGDMTGAVTRVSAERYETQQTTNLAEMLSGTVAGFASNQSVNAEGGGSMQIRGRNSLAASTTPLVVLDGVIFHGRLGDINPHDIETIDILKDASSSAVFGARSASGVVIVTTKRGQDATPTVRFSSDFATTGFTNIIEPRSPEDYLQIKTDYWEGQGDRPQYYYYHPDDLPADLSLNEWLDMDPVPGTDPQEVWLQRIPSIREDEFPMIRSGETTDWFGEALKPGSKQDYNLSISGGSEILRYYWSIGRVDNRGISAGASYGGHTSSYSARGEGRNADSYTTNRSTLNLDADVTNWLKMGLNTTYLARDESDEMPLINRAYQMSPYLPIYDEDGELLPFPAPSVITEENPFMYQHYRTRLRNNQSFFATINAEISLPLGFSYQALYYNRYNWAKNHLYDDSRAIMSAMVGGYGHRANSSLHEWSIDNIFRWNKNIGDIHDIEFTFLYNAEKRQDWFDIQRSSQFDGVEYLGLHGLHVGTTQVILNDDGVNTANAVMGRLNYTLMNRYSLTATYRRDGFSAFGQENPYGYFPSFALGWTISNEDFFNVDLVSYLRLRGSWGITGNQAIGRYAALAQLRTELYVYGEGRDVYTGFIARTMSNQGLRWEQSEAVNFGIDFGLFNNRITGVVEAYMNQTKDLLVNRSLPRIIGFTSVPANLGRLDNQGFETTLSSVNVNIPVITWRSDFVFSLNRNKIVSLYGDMEDVLDEQGNVIGQREMDDVGNQWFIGEDIDRVWEYEIDGIYQLGEEEEAAVYGRRPGDFRLVDQNDDGILTPLDDKVFLGYSTPRYRLGMRNDITLFQHFEISAFIRADLGHIGANNLHLYAGDWTAYARSNSYDLPYWTPDNPINDYGRLAGTRTPATRYFVDRSFVRLQDLTIAYNIPGSILDRFQINNFRVYLSFRNLLTITNWTGFDPESGNTPMPKSSNIGINMNF